MIETIDDPTPVEGEAVIQVERCGVCGTDVHMTSGRGNDFPIGSPVGHEYCGEVVAIGKGVENLKVGQRITTALGAMPDVVLECVGAVGMTQKAVELVAGLLFVAYAILIASCGHLSERRESCGGKPFFTSDPMRTDP